MKKNGYNPYTIKIIGNINNIQLAYIVNHNSFEIIICKSGHNTILKGKEWRDFEGGWLFIKQKKITFYCGAVGNVTSNRDMITDAISKELGVKFRRVD